MRQYALLLTLLLALVSAPPALADSPHPPRCTPDWFASVEARLPTGDGQGHGPDAGSAEWQSVVEQRLGVRGQPDVPARGSEAWCGFVERRLAAGGTGTNPGPAFDCGQVRAGSIEARICDDPALARLDRRLADVYRAALAKAATERPPTLKAEQRGWIKGRNDCWKAADAAACVTESYRQRTAELQARYRLVASTGPFSYQCGDSPADEIVVTYFDTDPPTLEAERGDSVSLMFAQPSASGARYKGPNESFWEHHGEASVQWGYGAREMTCRMRDRGGA